MSKKEKLICGLTLIMVSFGIVCFFAYREVKLKRLFLGYFKQMENAEKFKNDPNFDYDEFRKNLNAFIKEQLR